MYKLILTNKSIDFYVRECAEVFQNCYGGVIIEVHLTSGEHEVRTTYETTESIKTGTWG